MKRKKITIGLFGFGCVGKGLFDVLQATPGFHAEIKTICVKNRNKTRPRIQVPFTYDPRDILEDDDINVVVELIDDAEAAFEIVSKALNSGKAVVSANKKMIATYFEELLELQKQSNAPFLYEAACCASIPIIRNLEEYFDNDMLESIEGIVNGSTNYILTQTGNKQLPYQEALAQAQEAGFAESDPVLDTSGADARFKLMILLAHAFGLVVDPAHIFKVGIDRLGELELTYAREKGLKIKLVAIAQKKENGTITAFVAPRFVGPGEKLFHVDDVYNGLITRTAFADTQFFVGKGAGAYPTASAVLSDISALSYDYRYEYKKINRPDGVALSADVALRVFLSFNNKQKQDHLKHFREITETYEKGERGFIIGKLDLDVLRSILKTESVSAVVF